MVLALVQAAVQAATLDPHSDFIGWVAATIGGGAAIAYGAWVKFKPNPTADAKEVLDVTTLDAGSKMIVGLQADIARLRETQSANEAKWQADMQRLQDRLDAMAKQVDDAIAARRSLEEACAKLRLQLIQNNLVPVV